MICPTLEKVLEYAQDYTSIPVGYTVWSDQITPIHLYQQLKKPYTFLLESVEGGEKWARYSFIGQRPFLKYEVHQGIGRLYTRFTNVKEELQWHLLEETAEPISFLQTLLKKYKSPHIPSFSTFSGGAVGYIGYETVQHIEQQALASTKPSTLPEIMLFFCTEVIIFDHLKQELTFVEHLNLTEEQEYTAESIAKSYFELASQVKRRAGGILKKVQPTFQELRPIATLQQTELDWEHIKSNFTEQSFCQAVEEVKQFIQAGDIFQAVLSQEFMLPLQAEPFELYRVLRKVNPAPYLYYFDCGDDLHIVGSSPERLVQLDGERIETNPIAGTRKRGKNQATDLRLERELLEDQKEHAEHVMLVDLGRNDVGKVASYGSVKVTKYKELYKYAHVMHLVSTVEGKLREGLDGLDALLACFPAGTVSGAPKVRAMQIIEELENKARGIYAGAIGYFSFSGNLDSCIAIRTIIVRDKQAFVQAGAGIVADSQPHLEWKETRNKAKALLLAIQLANQFALEADRETKGQVKQYV